MISMEDDKWQVLFLQLPNIDKQTVWHSENPKLAAVYLSNSVRNSNESGNWSLIVPPTDLDLCGDAALIKFIIAQKPDVICMTLYLWNVERSVAIIRRIRNILPRVHVMAGGPEVAFDHPFLFAGTDIDMALEGDGESLFPHMLECVRTGKPPDYESVIFLDKGNYTVGSKKAEIQSLASILPSPDDHLLAPDNKGVAYLETGRACPYKCTFCRYSRMRKKVSFISAEDAVRRVAVMIERGAKEIRFIDPSMNMNPDFDKILAGLIRVNKRGRVGFFGEMLAEYVTADQAVLMKTAGFTCIEVGVQSTDPDVLRAVRRPADGARVYEGIMNMSKAGLKQTIDLMCGLPLQGLCGVKSALKTYAAIPGAEVQFLHALLLPGTEIRRQAGEYGMAAMPVPPYKVVSTVTMSQKDMMQADIEYQSATGLYPDAEESLLVTRSLRRFYNDRQCIDLDSTHPCELLTDRSIYRALIFKSADFWAGREKLFAIIESACRQEPHSMWQFILSTDKEFPLDLIDVVVASIKKLDDVVADRMAAAGDSDRTVSRRIFLLLEKKSSIPKQWVDEAEHLLMSAFR